MKVEPVFIGSCLKVIHDLREAGLSNYSIASVLTEIRAAAIIEHRIHLARIVQDNPPPFPTTSEVKDYLVELGS